MLNDRGEANDDSARNGSSFLPSIALTGNRGRLQLDEDSDDTDGEENDEIEEIYRQQMHAAKAASLA